MNRKQGRSDSPAMLPGCQLGMYLLVLSILLLVLVFSYFAYMTLAQGQTTLDLARAAQPPPHTAEAPLPATTEAPIVQAIYDGTIQGRHSPNPIGSAHAANGQWDPPRTG